MKKIIASVFFFIIVGSMIILFLVGSYEFAKDSDSFNIISQILLNWAISLVLFTIIIVYFVRVYSFKDYVTMSPEEWFSSFVENQSIRPTKFVAQNGRTYILDESKFSLLSVIEPIRIAIYSIFFLILSLVVSCYPFLQLLLSSNPPSFFLNNPTILLALLPIVGILFLPVFFLKSAYKGELAWNFEKEQKDAISLTISNGFKKKFHSRINKLDISNLSIIETDRKTLFPDLNSRFTKSTKPIYVLFVKFSGSVQDEINTLDEYHLYISNSREQTELMKKIFTIWINF